SVVILVAESAVTVFVVVVAPLEPKPCAAITTAEPDTEVTLPLANAPNPRVPVGAPDGRCPPVGKPERRAPDGKPDGRCPFPPPEPRAPPVHEPLTGELTTMVAAVNEVADEAVPVLATAMRQSPAFTAASVV